MSRGLGDVYKRQAQTLAKEVWENLNEDNKVSLFVQYVDLASGERDTGIINKHQ